MRVARKWDRVRKGLRALLLPATLALAVAALAVPGRANTITFNPGAGSTGPITGVSGFSYATTSVLAYGLSAPPATTGATSAPFPIYYESVINGTLGTTSTIGANYSINGSTNEFTVIAGFQETVTQLGGGNLQLNDASTAGYSTGGSSPNFFQIYANTAGSIISSGSPPSPNNATSYGTGAGFGTGTLILSGYVIPPNYSGNFSESTVTPTGSFNTSGLPTADTTSQTVNGSGSTQLTILVNYYNTSYFPNNPGALLFTTYNALPFSAVAPLTGFYSTAGASPDLVYGTNWNTGTTNALNGQSLMFQSEASSSFVSVPEPSSIIQATTAAMGIPMCLWFLRRGSRKNVA